MGPMADPDPAISAEHIAQLQSAARDALGAARGLLDAVERVLEDDERVASFVVGLTDVLRFASDTVAGERSPGPGTGEADDPRDVQHIEVS